MKFFLFIAAEEKAAKKSRIKQSLVKRARSVAIFSLKLKERRAREAEKQAQAAIDHAKVSFYLTLMYASHIYKFENLLMIL